MGDDRKINNVLLIDIPTYRVELPYAHRAVVEKRLLAQAALWELRTGGPLIRPGLTYSRGLLSLAACLERHGFIVRYLNFSDAHDRDRLLDAAGEVHVVGITALTPTVATAGRICAAIKARYPDVITVLGGPHVSARPVMTLRENPEVDFAMLGECEERLPALLRAIDRPDEVPGTAFRTAGGGVEVSAAPVAPPQLRDLPLPAYHLLSRPLAQYAHNIRTARGCPYKCEFCVERLSWHSESESQHSVDQVMDELAFLAKRLPEGALVHFSDAIFNIDRQRTGDLVSRIALSGFGLRYSCDTRVDLVTSSEIRALAEAGFVNLRMGFESAEDSILQRSQKSITHDMQLAASEAVRGASAIMGIHAYMIAGLPGTTESSLSADASRVSGLIEADIVDVVGNKVLVPYPGTPEFEKSQEMGLHILTHDWRKYDRRSYPVHCLDGLDADSIYSGYVRQEAALTEALLGKLQRSPSIPHDVTKGLDYLYDSYGAPPRRRTKGLSSL